MRQAIEDSGAEALVTSKEAGLALRLNGFESSILSTIDGASAAALGDSLIATSGYRVLSLNGYETGPRPAHEFDNHGLALL